MSTIVSCPSCRDPVTLPAEAHAALICPHCQAEFSMQPVLRSQPVVASFRQEIAQEVRDGLGAPRRVAAVRDEPEITYAEIRTPRRPTGLLGMLGHLVGLLGGGALGLVAGYYLLNWFGGPQFNVLEIPLPGIAHTQPGTSASTPVPQANEARGADLQPTEPPGGTETDGPHFQATQRASKANVATVSSRLPPPHEPTPEVRQRLPSSSDEDLAIALRTARDAMHCPACQSRGFVIRTVAGRTSPPVPCAICRGQASTGVTAEVYDKLCHLAEAITHFDAGEEIALLARQDVRRVLQVASAGNVRQQSIGRQAAQRLADEHRDGQGILLAGTITETRLQGRYHVTRLVLMGQPTPVSVISSSPVGLQRGERALIAGCIVRDPLAHLEDYRGDRAPVVWGGLPLPLDR